MRKLHKFFIIIAILSSFVSADAQDSLNVSTMGQSFFWGSLWNMDVYQEYLYVCDYNAYLWIVDLSNPESPQMMPPYKTPHHASDIIIEGSTAFIADGLDGGLVVLDLSEPLSPQVIGCSSLIEDYARHVEKKDTLVVLGVTPPGALPHDSQIYILNAADISNPVILNSVDNDFYIKEMILENNFLYLRTEVSVEILDLTDPLNVLSVASLPATGIVNEYALEVSDTLLLVDESYDIKVYSITDPGNPQLLSIIEDVGWSDDILMLDNIAYALTGTRINSIDMTDPMNPQELDDLLLGISDDTYFLHATEYGICISTREKGIRIVDNQNPQALVEIGSVDTPSNPNSIFVDNETAYLANRSYFGPHGAFVVMEVEDPYQPAISGCYDFGWAIQVSDVFVEGNLAYVLDTSANLNIVDISNPDSMSVLGNYYTGWASISCYVQNDTVYLCNGASGLKILDATDPENITLIGEYDSPGSVRTIHLDGILGYIADGSTGFAVLDLSDITQPQEIGRLDYDGYFEDIDYCNGIAYIADRDFGLHIIDVSNPENLEIISSYLVGYGACNLDYQWNYLYISDESCGLRILDVSDLSYPVEAGYYQSGDIQNFGGSYDVCVQGEIAYYTTPVCFYTLDISQAVGIADQPPNSSPFTFTLHPVYPNPFNASTTIPFTLDRAGKVKIDIFDITGRSVGVQYIEPLHGMYSAGTHEVVWNAKGIASGVYLMRLSVDGGQQSAGTLLHESRKVILLK